MIARGLALLLCVVALVTSCGRSDPERELRVAIDAMARAVEKRDPAAFLERVSDDFTRESGAFGKADAKRVLLAAFLRNEKIQVNAVVTDVHLEGDRAFAKVRVVATGGAGLLPERGQTWNLDSAWRMERGEWRVFNAEWREGL